MTTATVTERELDSGMEPVAEDQLYTRSFLSLISVSFFGAGNDNVLKQILVLMVVPGGLWANALGVGTQGIISLFLSVPFIILSGFAGQVADKYSKQRVIFWVKIAEIPIAAFALVSLAIGSFWMALGALLLLAIQSSFYGPAKFGLLPDLVGKKRLSQANGLNNAFTTVAVILGSLIAGPLADIYYPTKTVPKQEPVAAVSGDAESNGSASGSDASGSDASGSDASGSELAEATTFPVVATENGDVDIVPDTDRTPRRLPVGITLVSISLLGLCPVLLLPKIKAVDPSSKISFDVLSPHIQTFKDANRPLAVVLIAWSGFYFVAALALLMIPEYRGILGVTNTAIANLTGMLAVAIIVGSCSVGFLSGNSIRPILSIVGAFGMTAFFVAMAVVPMTYWRLAIVIAAIGFFAGFYVVPLQSLLQAMSPPDERGRFFGTANMLSFVFISGSGLAFYALFSIGVTVTQMAFLCAIVTALGTFAVRNELKRIDVSEYLGDDSDEP